MSKLKLIFLISIGISLLSMGVYYYQIPSSQEPPITNHASYRPSNHPIYALSAPGVIEPFNEVHEISSEVVGVIQEIHVEQNMPVKSGEIIATIENSLQKANLENAKAEVALSIAELALAKKEYERRSALGKSGALSQSDSDTAKTNYQVSTAQKSVAEAQLQQAQALLDKTLIRSPINGTILKRHILPGEVVTNQPPTLIVSIGNTEQLRVRAEVDENDIAKVCLGQEVKIVADTYPDKSFHGVVSEIAPQVGQKKIQTGRPQEKSDTKVMEVLVDLDKGTAIPIGLRVDAFFNPPTKPKTSPSPDSQTTSSERTVH